MVCIDQSPTLPPSGAGTCVHVCVYILYLKCLYKTHKCNIVLFSTTIGDQVPLTTTSVTSTGMCLVPDYVLYSSLRVFLIIYA